MFQKHGSLVQIFLSQQQAWPGSTKYNGKRKIIEINSSLKCRSSKPELGKVGSSTNKQIKNTYVLEKNPQCLMEYQR